MKTQSNDQSNVDNTEAAIRSQVLNQQGDGYKIKINGSNHTVDDPLITGREVLTLGGLTPPENYTLRVKMAGERPCKVALDEEIDLRSPGIEKFKALPTDQTEGS